VQWGQSWVKERLKAVTGIWGAPIGEVFRGGILAAEKGPPQKGFSPKFFEKNPLREILGKSLQKESLLGAAFEESFNPGREWPQVHTSAGRTP